MGGGDSSLECYCWEQTTKSGKSQLNLRDRLFELEVENSRERVGSVALLTHSSQWAHERRDAAVLRYVGSCRNDGNQLRPEQVIFMLSKWRGGTSVAPYSP